jgi:L-threonylcarbamoyladenylate synthase
LYGRIACILKSDQTKVGLESTVVDCTREQPVILRAGAVTLEQLREVIPETALASADDPAAPNSPGLKSRHYAPAARVAISRFPQLTVPVGQSAYIGLDAPPRPDTFARVLLCKSVEEYARSLFQFFRECDEAGIETIFCQAVTEEGLGMALMDRLNRAAHD